MNDRSPSRSCRCWTREKSQTLGCIQNGRERIVFLRCQAEDLYLRIYTAERAAWKSSRCKEPDFGKARADFTERELRRARVAGRFVGVEYHR
jgi:hypothetical protein